MPWPGKDARRKHFHPLTDAVKANTSTNNLDRQNPGTVKLFFGGETPEPIVDNDVFSWFFFLSTFHLRGCIIKQEKGKTRVSLCFSKVSNVRTKTAPKAIHLTCSRHGRTWRQSSTRHYRSIRPAGRHGGNSTPRDRWACHGGDRASGVDVSGSNYKL